MARKTMAKKTKSIKEDVTVVDDTNVDVEQILNSMSEEELDALAAELEAEEAAEAETDEPVEEEVMGTGGVPDGASRTNQMSLAMKAMSSMSADQIAFFNKSLEKYNPDVAGASAEANKASIAMKEAIKEDIATVFGASEDLSEELKEKMTVLFESAVVAQVAIRSAEIEEQFETKLEEAKAEIKDAYAEKIDEVIDFVTDEYMKVNELAIERSLRTEVAEEFMGGLVELLKTCNISVDEEKADAIELALAKIEELEDQLNNSVNSSLELTQKVKELERGAAVVAKAEGLTLVQAEKFSKLAEGVDYDGDIEAFEKKLDIIRESHFKDGKVKPTSGLVTEEIFTTDDENAETNKRVVDPAMRAYVAATKRTFGSK
jgi:hypothetical protein